MAESINCRICDKPPMAMDAKYTKKVKIARPASVKAVTCGGCIAKGMFNPGDPERLPIDGG